MASYSQYPARVYDGDRLVTNRGAVVVTDGRLRVAAFTADRKGVEIVLDRAGFVDVEAHISRKRILHFDDGSAVSVTRGDGCSCHNVLQKWYRGELGSPARSGS